MSDLAEIITNKIKCLDLTDSLTSLETIIEDKKIHDSKVLEIKETEVMITKILDEFKEEKKEELGEKIRLLMLKNRHSEDVDEYEEKKDKK